MHMTPKAFAPLLVLLFTSCFDVPLKAPVDLERGGAALSRSVTFEYAERYSIGFLLRPTFVAGNTWHVAAFSSEAGRAWAEFCLSVEIIILDESGTVHMRDGGRVDSSNGWSMTNGSQEADFPATIYKFLPFTPVVGEKYQVTLNVVEPCSGSNRLSPHFFIQRPMAGP